MIGDGTVGLANATDTGFNVELYHHNDLNWTYHATAFEAGGTILLDQNAVHSTANNIAGGEHFAFKRTDSNTPIAGSASEGLVLKVTTTVNNSISYMDSHLTVTAP